MGDIEFGKCDICGNETSLARTYYYYGIKCECHSNEHFEYIAHCSTCKPKPPQKTSIHLTPSLDRTIKSTLLPQAIKILQNALMEDTEQGSYYDSWKSNIAMAFVDAFVKEHQPYEDLHKIANDAADNFLKQFCS